MCHPFCALKLSRPRSTLVVFERCERESYYYHNSITGDDEGMVRMQALFMDIKRNLRFSLNDDDV